MTDSESSERELISTLEAAGVTKPTEKPAELGRVRIPNPGSLRYQLRTQQSRSARRVGAWKSKRWQMGNGLRFQSQGNTSHCVRFGNTHILMLEPIVRADAFLLTTDLYRWAQDNDPWPGAEPEYYGTSVDAGLQYLLKVAKVIGSYWWASSMDDVLTRLSAPAAEGGGPLVTGIDWYSGFDVYNTEGKPNRWHPTGWLRGGHCLDLIGHTRPTAKKEGTLLWGNSHDENYIGVTSYDEAEWILFSQGGEAAAPSELPRLRRAA